MKLVPRYIRPRRFQGHDEQFIDGAKRAALHLFLDQSFEFGLADFNGHRCFTLPHYRAAAAQEG